LRVEPQAFCPGGKNLLLKVLGQAAGQPIARIAPASLSSGLSAKNFYGTILILNRQRRSVNKIIELKASDHSTALTEPAKSVEFTLKTFPIWPLFGKNLDFKFGSFNDKQTQV
jgi:hypothetical protein